MEEFDYWIKATREWLIANADWLVPLLVIVSTVAAVIALRPVLFPPKSGGGGSGYTITAEGNVGPVAQAGDGGTATVITRDPLDRETIAGLNRHNERLLAENEGLKEQLERAVVGLDRAGAAQGRSEETVDEAKRALADGDTAKAEEIYLDDIKHKRAEESATQREMAESYRSLGALAFLHDTEKALSYYQEATRLDPDDPGGWNQLGHLQRRIGDLGQAERAYERVLELALNSENTSMLKAVAYGNLGIVHQMRGELDPAVQMYEKSLAIHQSLGRKEGTASVYGNLGNVYQTRGELDQAVEMHEKSLAINEALGSKEGMAGDYGNLGIVHQTRGELDRAVEMFEKSLAIEEVLGRKEGMASQYGNLGNVYQTRGELDRAVEMYEKSLAIDEALGRKEGMASQYGNLGNVYQTRGELDRAVEMFEKSLAISEALGSKEGVASQYGNLGNVYQIRGELDRAVQMYEKSLAINEALGRKEGMASQYSNLGSVYRTRGEFDRAVESWQRAVVLFTDIGSPNAALVQGWLDNLER